jgi:hypothetical protein
MSRPKLQSTMMATVRCLLALCVFGLLLGSNAMAMRATQKASRSNDSMLAAGAASEGKSFSITGDVGDLYPGARAPLNVQVTNPNNSPLTVRSIAVGVEDSDIAGCGQEWIRPGDDVRISALVPAKSTAHLSFPVRMLGNAPVVCQGASWTLNFTGAGAVTDGSGPSDSNGPPGGNGPPDGNPGPDDSAAPDEPSVYGSPLPFTGFNITMIAGLALALILIGVMLVTRLRSGNEA